MVACPSCGAEVEIWSDEAVATCSSCKTTITRPGALSCLEWCAMGKECVGDEVYGRYMTDRATSIRDRLLRELAAWFGQDTRRIDHATAVLGHAEALLRREPGDWHVVVPASILHDVGIKAAEEKYGSAAAHYQELEGPPVARRILRRAGLQEAAIEEICDMIGHHHSPRASETQNFKLLYDADWLVNLREALGSASAAERAALIERTFLTAAGRQMATQFYAGVKACRGDDAHRTA